MSIETGDANAIEIVGGESGVDEEEEIYNELQMHRAGMGSSYGLWGDCGVANSKRRTGSDLGVRTVCGTLFEGASLAIW